MSELRERLEEIRRLAADHATERPAIDVCDEIHEDATKALALLDGPHTYEDGHCIRCDAPEECRPVEARTVSRGGEVERLRNAVKKAVQFIENGVQFGHIRMPDPPDSALDTLPTLRAALNTETDE